MSLSLGPRRIYPLSVPDDYRASPSIAGLPRCAGLLSGFCSSGPSFASLPSGRPLPSDSASRRTPLLWLAVPVITARKGLAPSRYTTCLAHNEKTPVCRWRPRMDGAEEREISTVFESLGEHPLICSLVRQVAVGVRAKPRDLVSLSGRSVCLRLPPSIRGRP